MMRLLKFSLLAICLLWSNVAAAAQVQAIKWGLDKDNVLRIVVDLDDNASYSTILNDNYLTLRVNAPKLGTVPSKMAVRGTIAKHMEVQGIANATLINLPLLHRIPETGYKVFTLRKDPVTKRPFRVVMDIIADMKMDSVTIAKPTTPVKPNVPVVGNKPTVSNKPQGKPGTQVTQPSKSTPPSAPTKPTTPVVKPPENNNYKVQAIKATKPFRVGGGIKDKVIVVDAGHGGSDPGAIGSTGLKEKQVTLPIAQFLKKELENKGAKVIMTRTTDVDLVPSSYSDRDELQARLNVAEKNNADIFVSLHINAAENKKIGGFSTYYYKKTEHDERLAEIVQKKLADNFGVPNLGMRLANFYVVKRSTMPSILVEMCFITNKEEEKLMTGNWFRKKTAKMIAEGIEKYFK